MVLDFIPLKKYIALDISGNGTTGFAWNHGSKLETYFLNIKQFDTQNDYFEEIISSINKIGTFDVVIIEDYINYVGKKFNTWSNNPNSIMIGYLKKAFNDLNVPIILKIASVHKIINITWLKKHIDKLIKINNHEKDAITLLIHTAKCDIKKEREKNEN